MRQLMSLTIAFLVGMVLVGCSKEDPYSKSLNGEWLFKLDSLDQGVRQEWFSAKTDRREWTTHSLPSFWDRYANLNAYDGVGWYARTFQLQDTANPSSVYFGGVDDDAIVWINGKNVGSHSGFSEAFGLDISGAVKKGTNEIVIRVTDNGGQGGIYEDVSIVRTQDMKRLTRGKYADRPARKSADWVHEAVIYEVYLRSFSKEGTFRGLEKRLDELKSLGVTVLWLMPIHPVGEINRKGKLGSPYAVEDYYGINEEFGTLADFKSLVESAHRAGMKMIIDLVANHTSWDSKMLLEHPEWYKKNSEGAIVSPNPDWTDVAQLNYGHHELRKYMIEMMKYWVRDVGIDGFRCDVAELVPTDFWEIARGELDAIKPVMMLSEGKLPEHHIRAFDLTYSWNLYDILGDVISDSMSTKVFGGILDKEENQYPRNALRLRFNTNHDKNAWDAPAVQKFTPAGSKATAVLAFTFPGIPLVYNGEEVGNPKKLSLFDKIDITWTPDSPFRILYTSLAQTRKEHPALRSGDYRTIDCSKSSKILAFERNYENDVVTVIINFSQTTQLVNPAFKGNAKDCLSGRVFATSGGKLEVKLQPLGYVILTKI
jgi:cyclomaltodextrinase